MIDVFESKDEYLVVDSSDRKSLAKPQRFVKEPAIKHFALLVAKGSHQIKPFSEYVPHWLAKRNMSIADGGRGTIEEQLEMLGEKDHTAFKAHIKKIKEDHPKTD